MTGNPFAAPGAADLAKHLTSLLSRERQDPAYSQFRDELHSLVAATILAELDKATADDAGGGAAMRYFAASEVASSVTVNALSSLVVLLSVSDEVVAAAGDIDLFRRSLGDHLCEGMFGTVAKLVNERVLDILQDQGGE